MKQVYAVLVLALVLVFALGSVASAGILRGEDYDEPAGDPFDVGGLDEDHPWGGDRIIGEGEGDIPIDDKPVITITTTDYLYIDLWLTELYRLFISDEPVVTTTPIYEARPLPERSYRISRPASPIGDRKVVAR